MVYSLVFSLKYCTFAPDLKITYGDPLAQLVEHHTFNVGVLGSNPKRITETIIRGFFVNPLISFDTQALVFQLVGLEDFISMLNPMPNGMYREGKRPIGNHLRYKIS